MVGMFAVSSPMVVICSTGNGHQAVELAHSTATPQDATCSGDMLGVGTSMGSHCAYSENCVDLPLTRDLLISRRHDDSVPFFSGSAKHASILGTLPDTPPAPHLRLKAVARPPLLSPQRYALRTVTLLI
jgi:hypothetical protein